jgi:hypothetical protein
MKTTIRKIFHKRPRIGADTMTKKPESKPASTSSPAEESMKIKLDRETIQILIDDKIATGG